MIVMIPTTDMNANFGAFYSLTISSTNAVSTPPPPPPRSQVLFPGGSAMQSLLSDLYSANEVEERHLHRLCHDFEAPGKDAAACKDV